MGEHRIKPQDMYAIMYENTSRMENTWITPNASIEGSSYSQDWKGLPRSSFFLQS
jgi:hypothetical protein